MVNKRYLKMFLPFLLLPTISLQISNASKKLVTLALVSKFLFKNSYFESSRSTISNKFNLLFVINEQRAIFSEEPILISLLFLLINFKKLLNSHSRIETSHPTIIKIGILCPIISILELTKFILDA